MKKNSLFLAFTVILALVVTSCNLQAAPGAEPQPIDPLPQDQRPENPQPQETPLENLFPEDPQPEELPVEQPGEAKIIMFNSPRTSINSGECTVLEWDVQGGFGVSINEQPVERSGQQQVCPSTTTIYHLGVDTGKEILQREVTIIVADAGEPQQTSQQSTQVPPTSSGSVSGGCPGAPVISSFTANPTSITAGQSVTLSWGNITNGNSSILVESATLNPGFGEVGSGASSRSVKPTATTTYTLTGTGCGGTTNKQVTVTVNSSGSIPGIAPIPGGTANLDLAVDNIYPSASGHIMVTIKNVGNTVINTSTKLTCSGTEIVKSSPPVTPAISGSLGPNTQTLSFNLKPGEKFDQDTHFGRTPSTASMSVTCSITPPSSDTNKANNSKGPIQVK